MWSNPASLNLETTKGGGEQGLLVGIKHAQHSSKNPVLPNTLAKIVPQNIRYWTLGFPKDTFFTVVKGKHIFLIFYNELYSISKIINKCSNVWINVFTY